MPRVPTKMFGCKVISQTVHISLRRRPLVDGNGKLFVHCSEGDLECSPKFCSQRGVYWSVSDFRRMGLTSYLMLPRFHFIRIQLFSGCPCGCLQAWGLLRPEVAS